MNIKKLTTLALIAASMGVASEASAHRAWMLPSATVLSGDTAWVTMDGAISNSLFYFEHHPLGLEHLEILDPQGEPLEAQNKASGKYRSVFDAQLTRDGTYTFEIRTNGLFGAYKHKGKNVRWRGGVDEMGEIPAEAEDLRLFEIDRLMQVFVTKGAPTTRTFEAKGVGLEMVPVTHPNDLFVGETSEFQFLVDGDPAANLNVVVIRGGIRYRDQVDEIQLQTDAQGRIFVEWEEPGMYWLEAELEQSGKLLDNAKRRMSYNATLEVLPL
ncbi:DUF4198 domain-containing protein [Marinobacter sp. 1-4A]|uniref:DUF4198 domain-containing protein n=1 Tax=Marinobacter sp. 1-4A TaxID=2582919 RepID=UPI001908DCA5|nr:DUF4198 domain-containing protein [Marinobacter sp. 1-4A]MBK1849862.1 DUF4198 domain-containing protein [Marinobacter sp. 1-4A]